MNRTVLQIPVTKSLRGQAEAMALNYGFSSLQEVIRVFMKKLATGAIDISFQEVVVLSSKATNRYQKMDEDFKLGKNIYSAKTVKEFESQLLE